MAELRDQVSQYIGFKPNEIYFPITEEDRQILQEIILDQKEMEDIVMNDYGYTTESRYSKSRLLKSRQQNPKTQNPDKLKSRQH